MAKPSPVFQRPSVGAEFALVRFRVARAAVRELSLDAADQEDHAELESPQAIPSFDPEDLVDTE
jgi:hypothetical protein